MPPPLLPTLFFFLLLTAAAQDSDPGPDCTGRWIHIRQLPPQFNLDLLSNCSEYPVSGDFCPFVGNHGLGQKTHNSSRSWYRTDPLMLELIFHRRMLEYPCLTPDPSLASAIYLPYYAGLDALRYLYGPDQNTSFLHGLDLFRFLTRTHRPEIWNRRQGHDHFLVMARPAWDFSQPLSNDPPIFGTSFLESPEFFNVTALTLESRAYPWQEQAIPYPTSFHPQNLGFLKSWIQRVRRTRRSSLMLFAGGGGISANPNIRRSIRLECDNVTSLSAEGSGFEKFCDFVDCSSGICEHDPIRFMRPMLRASFCLQPPGDTPTRRSTFDAMVAGCIPVFFEEQSAKKQYTWHMAEEEYGEWSVFIAKEDVVGKEGVRIMDVLMGIPRTEVRRMRERVVALIERVVYRKHGSSSGLRSKKDAFDIAVEGALQRINSRVHQILAHSLHSHV
ncbi:probable xyloglucan galactosyltransferase GT19 [Salvia splendens]|uniref:probable xyloglucan galactosyltransferase GT19 n=1 Tax=Salvia splendens TaxID=180675 RepID=UPI001C269626|nr:probable xyloglucan galactosyltransferase GT19 [Salvia splendens]